MIVSVYKVYFTNLDTFKTLGNNYDQHIYYLLPKK